MRVLFGLQKLALFSILGFVSALLSGYVAIYEVADEIDTIGVKTWYGFPLQHVMNAPGLAWAQWDFAAFIINTVLFSVVYWFSYSLVKRKKQS